MLLRFSVSNFGSIRDRQELSMIASHAIKDEPSGLIDAPELRKEKVLPAAVIYGANASGKSNFVKALAHMITLVRDSHRRGEPGGGVPLKPFLLDPEYAKNPSEFSIDFILNGARYLYSFEAIKEQFTSESLYIWRNNGSRAMLFERIGDKFEFGRSLKGENRIIEKITRPNSLFLSAAAQTNHLQLSEVAHALPAIAVEQSDPVRPKDISRQLAEEGVGNKTIKLLSVIEAGVIATRIEVDLGVAKMFIQDLGPGISKEFSSEAMNFLKKSKKINDIEINDVNDGQLQLGHKGTDGRAVYFDMEDESAGTVQLLSILGPVFRALDEGGIVIIDEFGSRLHTRAAETILSLFNNKETNPKGAQLIVATHDTNLLNAKGLRRDQVWFTEKDEGGATHLYPLTDIETRKGDNLEKGYLQGRYGAIPFAGPLADFVKAS
jgi:AAA15 family ATPase/GTPase